MNAQTPPPLADQARMIESLRRPGAFPFPADEVQLIETHISWVLLAGEYAYKIKKAVGLDFLDYSTLEDRRFFCEEELRLNRRTAATLYLDLATITGPPENASIEGNGPVIDYAVRMKRFDDSALLARVLEHTPPPDLAERLAAAVAAFHQSLRGQDGSGLHGQPDEIRSACAQVTASLSAMVDAAEQQHEVRRLSDWSECEGRRLEAQFTARRQAGRVRECHGDLHCGNVLLIDGQVMPFDGIEFSASLRTIDVIDDLAFLLMDLAARDHPQVAHRCLNLYLEATADYDGLRVLRYYLCYRALVRAMVESMQAGRSREQPGLLPEAAARYLAVAAQQTVAARPAIVLTHGFSGAGKSSLALALCNHIGAIRLRADVERSRLYGSGKSSRADKYSAAATEATYEQLARLATAIVGAGWPVVVDATFLKRWQRERFAQLARRLEAPLAIVDFRAPPEVLRARITARSAAGTDASEADLAVLELQLAGAEPIGQDECGLVLRYDACRPLADAELIESWHPLPALLRREGSGAGG